jgi:hypothetical protein
MSTFRQAVQLSRLSLPLCNDLLLKAIAVYCRYGDYPLTNRLNESNKAVLWIRVRIRNVWALSDLEKTFLIPCQIRPF